MLVVEPESERIAETPRAGSDAGQRYSYDDSAFGEWKDLVTG